MLPSQTRREIKMIIEIKEQTSDYKKREVDIIGKFTNKVKYQEGDVDWLKNVVKMLEMYLHRQTETTEELKERLHGKVKLEKDIYVSFLKEKKTEAIQEKNKLKKLLKEQYGHMFL